MFDAPAHSASQSWASEGMKNADAVRMLRKFAVSCCRPHIGPHQWTDNSVIPVYNIGLREDGACETIPATTSKEFVISQ